MRWVGVLLLASLAGAQEPAARFRELRAALAEERAALAQWAFDEKLYREAGYLARETLREKPDHAIARLGEQIQEMKPAAFGFEYKQAIRKRGREFQQRWRKIAEPAAAAFAHCNGNQWNRYDNGYPHAALLLHFLLEGPEHRYRSIGFDLLLAEMTQGGLRKKDLFGILGTTPEELEAALRAHAEDVAKRCPARKYGSKKD